LRWFIVRVLAVAAALGVPILGTSLTLVSSESASIATAMREHTDLVRFGDVVELLSGLELIHRDVTDHDDRAMRRDSTAVEREFVVASGSYLRAPPSPAMREAWSRSLAAWSSEVKRGSYTDVDGVFDALLGVSAVLDDETDVESDPIVALQFLGGTITRHLPKTIKAIRHSADETLGVAGPALDPAQLERIAAGRAIESDTLDRAASNIAGAIADQPQLGAHLRPLIARSQRQTRAFDQRIDRILATYRLARADRVVVEHLARAAIDAQIAVWREVRVRSDGLVLARIAAETHRRQIVIACSLLAVVFGTIAIVIIGRHMARRDRIELVSARLEGDVLRSKLQRISAERALRLREAQLRTVFENTNLGIAVFDVDGTVIEHNRTLIAMLGDRAQPLLANQLTRVRAFARYSDAVTFEERHLGADGAPQWLALTLSGVYDEDTCEMVVLLLRDATAERLVHDRLLHAANHDGLTQIANRSAFDAHLRRLFEVTDERFALMYVDLDKFKPVNDTFGHAAGDEVLMKTAERLRAALSGDDFCARLGGDEFAAIIHGDNDASTLSSIGLRVGKAIGLPIPFGGEQLVVTASIGIAIRSAAHQNGSELQIAADLALYAAKESGGNGWRIAAHPALPQVA
jgi:diguanylate cyclase (GGDEF)-like protein